MNGPASVARNDGIDFGEVCFGEKGEVFFEGGEVLGVALAFVHGMKGGSDLDADAGHEGFEAVGGGATA